jgi:N-acetylglutamate synthase-like GNAT family acetyltransferase
MAEITLRKARARDVPALKQVLQETFEGTSGAPR